jgi:menaquinone-dependent protoporphyrinogen IX oxidase
MRQSTMGNRQIVQGYLKPVLEQYADLRPIDIGYFGGKVDFKQISGPQKFMLWLQPKLQGDFRDWGAIREWAGRLALRLVTEQPTQVGMA